MEMKNMYCMQDIYNRIQQMNIDYMEYFHLKLLLFCRWGECLSSTVTRAEMLLRVPAEPSQSLNDHLSALELHVRRTYPLQPQRFEQLKSLLSSLRSVASPEVQNVFFKNIIGYCSIELILRNLYETITTSSPCA